MLVAAPADATFPGKNGKIAGESHNYNTCCPVNAFVGRNNVLFTVNPDGTARSVLAEQLNGQGLWSPDGTQLAFLSGVPTQCCSWDNGIEISLADGSQRRTLLDTNLRLTLDGWSPDGSKLLFSGEQKYCHPHVYAISPDDGELVQFSEGEACPDELPGTDDRDGTWSADGSLVAFVRADEIWRANADGSGSRQLTTTAEAGLSLGRNPGPYIAFVADHGGFEQIEAIDWDGTHRRQLTNFTERGSIRSLSWSPDGTRLLFLRDDDLYRIDSDGSELVRLTTGPDLASPVWSPDGRQIALSGFDPRYPHPPEFRYDARAVFTMNADGTGRFQVTTSPDMDVVTDWQAIPEPRRSDFKNAAKFCKAERAFWGKQFVSRYGRGKNAYGKCVSGK
jgi:Tol biopolymer transport system component